MGKTDHPISQCAHYVNDRLQYNLQYFFSKMNELADQLCESEIEKFFFITWVALLECRRFTDPIQTSVYKHYSSYHILDMREQDGRTMFDLFLEDLPFEGVVQFPLAPRKMTLICPQVDIESYRVDFVLLRRQGILTEKGLVPLLSKLIVECDGHEYHEKTKEQAQRDKARDRCLQTKGYYVFRFTGSELFNDIVECAMEIETFFALRAYEIEMREQS